VTPGNLSGIARKQTKQTDTQNMKSKAIFYHAGCPVCVAAERSVAAALDPARYEVEIVHLGQDKRRVAEAERAGVKSVPALVLDGAAYHINFGAGLEALR
jgi:glutaredoxin